MSGPSNWATPPDLYAAICQHYGYTPQLDVCAETNNAKCGRYYDLARGEDGLALPWDGLEAVWCNPPYSDPLPWVQRAVSVATVPVIMLLKNDPSTKWFRLILDNATIITTHTRRIQHIPPQPPPPRIALTSTRLTSELYRDTTTVTFQKRKATQKNNFTSVSALIKPRFHRASFRCEYWDWKTGDIWP